MENPFKDMRLKYLTSMLNKRIFSTIVPPPTYLMKFFYVHEKLLKYSYVSRMLLVYLI